MCIRACSKILTLQIVNAVTMMDYEAQIIDLKKAQIAYEKLKNQEIQANNNVNKLFKVQDKSVQKKQKKQKTK